MSLRILDHHRPSHLVIVIPNYHQPTLMFKRYEAFSALRKELSSNRRIIFTRDSTTILMHMLQTDWLSYSYTISHNSAVVVGRPQNATFYRFSEVLEESLDVNE